MLGNTSKYPLQKKQMPPRKGWGGGEMGKEILILQMWMAPFLTKRVFY